MAISVNEQKQQFILTTQNTEYVFEIMNGVFPVHCYYGKKKTDCEFSPRYYYSAFSSYEKGIEPNFSMNDMLSEFAFFGNGNFNCSSLKLRSSNGDCCTRFIYKTYKIIEARPQIKGLPHAKASEKTETLGIVMTDAVTGCELVLYYTVFYEYDVISRYFTLENKSEHTVKIEKAMSLCLDLEGKDYDMISLYGAHCFECNYQRKPLFFGNQSITSRRGASGHSHNPFMAVVSQRADEDIGDAYAFNLVYSGCFLDEIEVDYKPDNFTPITRIGIGVGEENFGYMLENGEIFYSPEAVMLYTPDGIGDMSRKMHKFIRDLIVPDDKLPKRPVVLNSWEAFHFDIDEEKLIAFARQAVKYGMDMLVMDDGWFGSRNHDRAGLGDWYVNKNKFPDGLKAFVERIKDCGIKFGIWIEPEMVNPDSDLYRNHPDWCISCKDRENSLSRHQLVLDFSNPKVIDYIKGSFKETFKDVPIDYIKWDFNRNITEAGSYNLRADRQDEIWHRFMLGSYELYNWFKTEYPDVMIENCSGGGGRYDLGMMANSTQIWTSDNTTAKARVYIQYGSQFAYPASVMSCHVSNPMKSDDYMRCLDYKFKVALAGMLGYELNITLMPDEVKEEISHQIELYRKAEPIIKYGGLYRLINPFENVYGISSYYYLSENEEQILLSFLQTKGDEHRKQYTLKVKAADKTALYKDCISQAVFTGEELVNGIAVTADTNDEYGLIWLLEKQ